jgi:hypothetical protein
MEPGSGPHFVSIRDALALMISRVLSRDKVPETAIAISSPKLWPITAATSNPHSIHDLAKEYCSANIQHCKDTTSENGLVWKIEGKID